MPNSTKENCDNMSYDPEDRCWHEDLALQRPDGLAIILDTLNPALAQVADVVEAEVPKTPANWRLPGCVGTYLGYEFVRFFQICTMGAMINALEDGYRIIGFAHLTVAQPTLTTPFAVLEIEVPCEPGAARRRVHADHPSNPDWDPPSNPHWDPS